MCLVGTVLITMVVKFVKATLIGVCLFPQMAELTDDFGSDAEEYEDALEELAAEEQKLSASREADITPEHSSSSQAENDCETNHGVETTVNAAPEKQQDKGDAQGNVVEVETINKDTTTAETSKEKDNITDNPDAKEENSESTDSEVDEDDDEGEDGDSSVPKAYCDIPADPSLEEDNDALHKRLNEQMDKDEDEVDDDVEEPHDIYFVDEEAMKALEVNMTDEEKQVRCHFFVKL